MRLLRIYDKYHNLIYWPIFYGQSTAPTVAHLYRTPYLLKRKKKHQRKHEILVLIAKTPPSHVYKGNWAHTQLTRLR